MKKALVPALAALSLTHPVTGLAAAPADVGAGDPRVAFVTYRRDAVTPVRVAPGTVTRIILGDDERIEVSASGLTADCQNADAQWCIHADVGAREVWIKPKAGAQRNNIELRTDKRDYSIELKTSAAGKAGQPVAAYRVIFRYPIDLPKASLLLANLPGAQQKTEAELLRERLAAAAPKARNWRYTQSVKGRSREIAPNLVFDDGRFTYFRFPANREVPAVFYVNPAGEEERVNFHMEGDLLVVERMGRRFSLRLGKSFVTIWNEAFDADGVAPEGGTSVVGVIRGVKD